MSAEENIKELKTSISHRDQQVLQLPNWDVGKNPIFRLIATWINSCWDGIYKDYCQKLGEKNYNERYMNKGDYRGAYNVDAVAEERLELRPPTMDA